MLTSTKYLFGLKGEKKLRFSYLVFFPGTCTFVNIYQCQIKKFRCAALDAAERIIYNLYTKYAYILIFFLHFILFFSNLIHFNSDVPTFSSCRFSCTFCMHALYSTKIRGPVAHIERVGDSNQVLHRFFNHNFGNSIKLSFLIS